LHNEGWSHLSSNVRDFVPLDHVLSPKYEILDEGEKKELMNKYKIKPHNLPKILASDPAVKALGGSVGDVLKIIRRSQTAGDSTFYRLVVVE